VGELQRLLILGGSGFLGSALVREWKPRPYVGTYWRRPFPGEVRFDVRTERLADRLLLRGHGFTHAVVAQGVTLQGLVHEAVQICPRASIFPMALSVAQSADLDMTALLPSSCDFGEGHDLGVYLLINSLPWWRKMKQVCDAALHQGSRVKLAFRHQTWVGFALGHHTWIHSLLLTFFPCEEYDASLELLLEPSQTDGASEKALVDVSARVPVPILPRDSCIGFIVTLLPARH
jgi:hypothetical protein